VLHAARLNAGHKNWAKSRYLRIIPHLCQAISSQLRHYLSTVRKNFFSNIYSACPYNMVNFGPLTADIGLPVRGTPANLNGFRVMASLLHRCRSKEVNQTLLDVWPSPGLVHYIYIFRGSCTLTEFCQVQNSLCVQVLHYCTALEKWALAKFCGVVSSRDRVATPFDTSRSNCLVNKCLA